MHCQLVKKLADKHLESYSRWLNVHINKQSVSSLCDWLKEEVAIKVKAVEMAHGLNQKRSGDLKLPAYNKGDKRSRTYLAGRDRPNQYGPTGGDTKPPVQFPSGLTMVFGNVINSNRSR